MVTLLYAAGHPARQLRSGAYTDVRSGLRSRIWAAGFSGNVSPDAAIHIAVP